jgi:hypothetical protein
MIILLMVCDIWCWKYVINVKCQQPKILFWDDKNLYSMNEAVDT